MPPGSLIIGVDLAPIKAIPRCITFQSDITTEKCRATIRQHLKTWKADTVLHDGAPNVGAAWVQDAFSQAELVLESLRLATDFLAPGGTFITKIFRSKDYNSLLWVFNQLFGKVEATKPPSSRNVSAEIFVVCRDFKAPKRIDPRFLDPKTVFAELADPTPNNEAKVFNPEVKKRKREGYAEGEHLQFKEVPVSEFIQTTDPIAMLGSNNKLSFDHNPNGDIALAALDKMPETTTEIRACCADLKVLGRKDFKLLLRWRLKVRDIFGFATKKKTDEAAKDAAAGEEVAEVEPMDEEMQMQEDIQRLKDQTDTKKKKERRRDNEKKRKEIVRMQMNMTTPMELGLEQAGPYGDDAMFALKAVDKAGGLNTVANGRMHTVAYKPEVQEGLSEEELDSDEDGDNLEGQLDDMYAEYQERKAEVDAKYKAKKARKEHVDEDFEGFSDRGEESSDNEVVADNDSDDSSDEEAQTGSIFHKQDLSKRTAGGLSKRASMFFDQDIFKGIGGLDDLPPDDDSGIDMNGESEESEEKGAKPTKSAQTAKDTSASQSTPAISKEASAFDAEDDDSDAGSATFEVVKAPAVVEDDWNAHDEPMKNGRPDIDIITAEAMTLAHALATGAQTRQSLADDSFNKYALRDVDGLPEWFLDDEGQHSRPQRPITAAGAAAIKEKLRALNARPIKKVREAKDRKKFKAAQRLEKLKRKSAMLVEDTDMSEKDKARSIEKMMAKAAKKKPKAQVKLVIARGANRRISGRPKGTKGKYKMVDARLKKDVRGEKRAAKRNKKSR